MIGDVIQVYSGSHGRTIVFCETKKEANELAMNASIKQVHTYTFNYKNSDNICNEFNAFKGVAQWGVVISEAKDVHLPF